MTITLKDIHIANCKVGISSDGPISGIFDNVTFDNVEKPFDIRGASDIRASGTRIRNSPPAAPAARATQVGYTGRNGPPLPAYCPRCHSIFPSSSYDIGSSSFYGFDNEETCKNPSCRYEHAKVANGLFDLAKEVVVVLQAEALTHSMLAAIQNAAEGFLRGELEADETVAAVSKISQRLGAILGKAFNHSASAAGIIALWFVIFPSHLSALQQKLGEQENDLHRNYRIERVCLEAFGQASQCRFIVSEEVIDEGERQTDTERVKEEPSDDVKAAGKTATESEEPGTHVDLPLHGPYPTPRP